MMRSIVVSLLSLVPIAVAQTSGNIYFSEDVINFTTPPDGHTSPSEGDFAPLTCKASDGTDQKATVEQLWPNTGVAPAASPQELSGACGDVRNPCIVGMKGVTAVNQEGCNTCYNMKIVVPATPQSEVASCSADGCPAYESLEIFTVVRGGLGDVPESVTGADTRQFDLSRLGWYMVCPVLCEKESIAGSICVATKAACDEEQTVADDLSGMYRNVLGSTAVANVQPAEWQLVDCETGSAITGPEDPEDPNAPEEPTEKPEEDTTKAEDSEVPDSEAPDSEVPEEPTEKPEEDTTKPTEKPEEDAEKPTEKPEETTVTRHDDPNVPDEDLKEPEDPEMPAEPTEKPEVTTTVEEAATTASGANVVVPVTMTVAAVMGVGGMLMA